MVAGKQRTPKSRSKTRHDDLFGGYVMTKMNQTGQGGKVFRMRSAAVLAWLLACGSMDAWAENVIEAVNYASLPGGDVEVAVRLKEPVGDPQVFSTDSPARIAVDFADTTLGNVERMINIGSGATKGVSLVEAAGRTRVVVDLFRASPYQTSIDGNTLLLRIGSGGGRQAVAAVSGLAVDNLDFRRGKAGEGRVIISFSGEGAAADLRREGDQVVIDINNASLGSGLAKRYDVLDFATPVESIEARSAGAGSRVTINVAPDAEPIAYQAGTQYVVEISQKAVETSAARKALEPPTYAGQRVTFNFQDIPVRSVLQLVADVSEQNIAVSDSVTGNVTLRLIDVPWDQALDIILQAKGLDKRRNGNVIWVAPTKEIADREQALEDARIALEERAPLISDFININYGKAEDIAKLLTSDSLRAQAGVGQAQATTSNQGFLSNRGSVSFDERTNTLLINDTAARIQAIRELIVLLDRPVEQVLIESRIVVANDDFGRALGARFGLSGAIEDSDNNLYSVGGTLGATDAMTNVGLGNRLNRQPSALPVGGVNEIGGGVLVPSLVDRLNVNLPVAGAAGGFGLTVLGEDYLLDLELSALETEGRGEVISSPRVITASQREALIRQGNEIPYTTAIIDQDTGAVTQQVSFKQVVLELKVTPTISPDQRIFMNLEVKQDSLADLAVNGNPAINTRNINTAVLVDNGQTVVLGGILERERREDTTQVPVLGDIPALGNLFKRRSRSDQKQELLIFVTPKILDTSLR